MPNALIYSPNFDGHRQMYVFVLYQILRELGYKTYVAGNLQAPSDSIIYIKKIQENSDARVIDTSPYPKGGFEIGREEFYELQQKLDVDLTIFPEADNQYRLLLSQIPVSRKRLRGQLIGIFLRPFYFHEKLSLIGKLKHLKHLPSYWQEDQKLFFDFFLKRFDLLDTVLCIDEKFVSKHSYSQWIPDVFQNYAETLLERSNGDTEDRLRILEEFKIRNKGRFVFFYFGTAQYRRGYDSLLKMAHDSGGCFIHCGMPSDDPALHTETIEQWRHRLLGEGRCLETNEFIENPKVIEAYFKAATHIILPYRKFYGSSGVMIQALNYGMPVLVPENGIMGHRVKKYHLGLVYDERNPESFRIQYDRFIQSGPSEYKDGISTFMQFQNSQILLQRLKNVITGQPQYVSLP